MFLGERNMFEANYDISSAIKQLHAISFNPLIEGINSNEYHLLEYLYNNETKQIVVSDITNKLKIAAPSVTKLLNGLDKKGYTVREIDPSNRRNTFVYITDEGKNIVQHNKAIISKVISDVYDNVGRENIVQFLHLAKLIHEAFEEEIKLFKNTKGDNN